MGKKLLFVLGLCLGMAYGGLCLLAPRLNRALERRWQQTLLSRAPEAG